MASIVVTGDTSGAITIAAPAVAGTNTLTLPASTGTLVVTGGAQTIEFADGSAAAPSITNSGDTNTGMFFPAADTIAFTEGGTESMRIASNGYVGIGTNNPSSHLVVNSATATQFDLLTNGTRYFTAYTDPTQVILGGIQNTIVSFRQNDTLRMQLDTSGNLLFNSGYGSVATAYGCRAWVNFNGQGTVAIRASGNVSSITDTGVGTYTVNLTNAMPDANYSVQSLADGAGIAIQAAASNTNGRTTSNYQVNTYNGALTPTFATSDFVAVMSAIFR